VLWAIGFALGSQSPSNDDPSSKIVSWYNSSSHQNSQVIAFFMIALGVLCMIGFVSGLRDRMAAAEGRSGNLSGLAFGAGIAYASLLLTAVALFVAPAFLAEDTGAKTLDPNTYRMLSDAGYTLWFSAAGIGALTVWATSAVALRRGLLPRWFAWFGVLCGIVQLIGGIFFIPALIYWLWILIASALLARSPVAAEPAVGAAPSA
jgi:hypothetical protein